MRPGLRVRQVVNWANGSTLAGLGVAAFGRARVARAPDGLLTGTGYRLPVPPAPAFCLGNVIVTRRAELPASSGLFRHEARHATQYAWCGGVVMVPLYLVAAGVSWAPGSVTPKRKGPHPRVQKPTARCLLSRRRCRRSSKPSRR